MGKSWRKKINVSSVPMCLCTSMQHQMTYTYWQSVRLLHEEGNVFTTKAIVVSFCTGLIFETITSNLQTKYMVCWYLYEINIFSWKMLQIFTLGVHIHVNGNGKWKILEHVTYDLSLTMMAKHVSETFINTDENINCFFYSTVSDRFWSKPLIWRLIR